MRPDGVSWTPREAERRSRGSYDPERPEAGTPGTEWPEAGRPTTAKRAATVPGPGTYTERALVTLAGVRQPIVALLLVIAVFTVLARKPLDGLLLAVVAIALAWDAGTRARRPGYRARPRDPSGADDRPEGPPWPDEAAWRPRPGRPHRRIIALGATGAVIYSLTVGSFSRMSWPATAGVVGLGAGAVIIGWGGPTRQRALPGPFSRTGTLAWGSLIIAGCIWELAALVGQPSFAQSSFAHPTISTLTDPLLSTSPGRTIALLGWLGLGAFLVER